MARSQGVAGALGAPFIVQALVAIAASAALLGVAPGGEAPPSSAGRCPHRGGRSWAGAPPSSSGSTPTAGRVKLAGEIWSARSYDHSVIEIGASVDVVEIQGATALVYEAEGP